MNKNKKTLQVRYNSEYEERLIEIMTHLNKEFGVPSTKSSAICALINLKHNEIKKGGN